MRALAPTASVAVDNDTELSLCDIVGGNLPGTDVLACGTCGGRMKALAGEMAKSNGTLVGKAVELSRLVGREPATVDEARKLPSLA